MTRKLLVTFITLVLAGAFLLFSLFYIDPNGAYATYGLLTIYLSLFFLGTSFFGLLLFFGKELISQKSMNSQFLWMSLRRGSFISLVIVLSLLLSYMRMFSFIEFFMLVLFFALLEFIFFFSNK